MASEESMELQALSPGSSFTRNLSVFFFFLRDERWCVRRIWLLFILLAYVCPDLLRFHFEQPPSILLRLLDSWI